MQRRRVKKFAAAVGIAMALCAFSTHDTFGQVEDFPALESAPPTRPACDLWIEGEAWTRHTGWEIRADATCYDGRVAVLSTKTAGDYRVDYEFSVDRPGSYLVCSAGQPLGRGYTSPVSISMDGGGWQSPSGGACSNKAWGPAGAVNWTNLMLATLQSGRHVLSVRVNGPRNDGVIAYMIDAIALIHEPYRRLSIAPKLVTDQPGNVFTCRQKSVFRLKWQADFGTIRWHVTDWQNKPVGRGTWNTLQGPLELPDLPTGFYRLTWKDAKSRQGAVPFSRVVDLADRVIDVDSSFAIDSAQSWHAVTPGNRFAPADPQRYLARLLQLAGVTIVRDRFNWGQEKGQPCTWDFNGPVFDILSQHGMRVCAMYHYAPGWTMEGSDSYGLPHDLQAVYAFCRDSAKRFPSEVAAWEFWNEEDATTMPAWYYAATMKAAYLGYKAGNPAHRVLNGASCLHPVPRFMDIFMQNGMKDYFDVYNCHLYSLQDSEDAIRDEQAFLKRYSAEGKPIWITENGFLQGGSAEPLDPATSFYEHDESEELAQAEYVIKAQLRFAAYGVARSFSFIFVPCNEMGRGRVWGMLRWDYVAKPVYVAFANMTAQLATARYVGAAPFAKGVVGMTYRRPSGEQTCIAWLETGGNGTITLHDSAAALQHVDFMGRSTTLHPTNGEYRIPVGQYPVYINGLKDIQPRRPALSTSATMHPASTRESTDATIVVRPVLGDGFRILRNKACVDSSDRGRMTLDVFSFSETAKRGHIDNLGRGYTVTGLPQTIDIPAMGKVSLTIDVVFDAGADSFLILHLGGTFNDRSISPVYIPIKRSSTAAAIDWPSKPLAIENTSRWKPNTSGTMSIFRAEAEKAIGFKVAFPPVTDQWIYPEFHLSLPGESLAGAIGLEFEIRASHDENWAMVQAVMSPRTFDGSGEMCWLPYLPTTQWQTVRILFEEDAPVSFDPSRICVLRIGANPSDRVYEYYLRNLRALYPRNTVR